MRILGIDPGSNATGYGVLDRKDGQLRHVAHGVLRPRPGAALPQRLATLVQGLQEVMAAHRPDAVAVEQVFVSASPRSALVLGQARGAVLAVLGGAGLHVAEYGTRTIKQCVAGDGSADKRAVQRMVRRSLDLDRTPASDAADALAAAICHAHSGRLAALGVGAYRERRRRGGSGSWVVRRAR
jgi:crossover junction endodeoxyribonuclease RuvC